MPDTIAPSPATSIFSFRQFRRLGTAADGGRQAIENSMGLCISTENAGAPWNAAENARLANTPSTAVQHDRSSRQASAVALTFRSVSRHPCHRNVRAKTALEP